MPSGITYLNLLKVRHYIGPSVSFQSAAFAASEAWIANVYDPRRDLNLYKMSADDLFEYRDVSESGGEAPANVKEAVNTYRCRLALN